MKEEAGIQDHTKQQSLKDRLIGQLQASDNPLVLDQIKAVLDEEAVLDQIAHIPLVQQLIKEKEKEDFEVRTRLSIDQNNKLNRYDAKAASIMFYLGVLSLLLIGTLITAFTEENPSPLLLTLLPWLSGLMGLLYLLFAIDASLLFYRASQSKQRMNKPEKRRRLLAILFPPLRIGSRNITTAENIWIPRWQWCKVNEGLFLELKRRFVLPMIGIALLIVPVLVIEWKFLNDIREEMPNLKIDLILDAIQTFIWCAFTFEFLLMISISGRKLHYVKKNWIDLLIILLPFASFLRTLRISQIARLKYATRSFKLRGVVTKARQGLIFVDFIQRIFRLRPESEIKRLYRLLQENQRDREDLQEKLKDAVLLVEKKRNDHSS